MNRKIAAAFAGFVVAASATVHAQELPRGLSPDYVACSARAHGSTVQANLCSQTEMVSQDARLNKAYRQVMKQLASDSTGRQNLQRVEQSWLKQRVYECQIDDHTTNVSCLVRKTAIRANELEGQVRF